MTPRMPPVAQIANDSQYGKPVHQPTMTRPGNTKIIEDSVPAAVVEGLKKLGHKTTSVVGPLGGGQAIWIDWDKGPLTGGSDPRKDGCALGY